VDAGPPFDIDVVMDRVREAVRRLPPAVLFKLADDGYTSAFEQLVACIISIRTREEVTLPTALRLFVRARTPQEMIALSPEEIDRLIGASTFHEGKARQIHAIARRTVDEYAGMVPCDFAALTAFEGVGPKCANLVLSIACGQPRIGVDIHVHRVTNRWGYVQGKTPEATLAALEQVLPLRYWAEINRLLVPFGRSICTGTAPRCATCPVIAMCRRVGVTEYR
jgi:endonuclease-3